MKPRDDNKVQEIYQATLKLVKQHGLAGITMQSIAKEAGIATGTLYIYFQNKEELILKLFLSCIATLGDVYFVGYTSTMSFQEGFQVIWKNMVQYRSKNFETSIFIEQCFHSPFIDEETKVSAKLSFQPFVKLIEKGKAEGIVKNIDTFWLMCFILGSTSELVKRANYFNKKLSPNIVDNYFQLCWDGIKQH